MAQVLSKKGGKIGCTLENGDRHETDFKPTSTPGVFAAEVEIEVAEHLLGKIGPPSFFKETGIEVKSGEDDVVGEGSGEGEKGSGEGEKGSSEGGEGSGA